MMDGMGMGMLWMVLWGLVGLALLVLIVVGIIWLIRQLVDGSSAGPARGEAVRTPARQELDRRYAAGEIDQGEYRRLRSEIERS
ncbi:SHOCT domain-containing protein [Spinactinospora alkalitolerans]|uniref:SHOCT domain-containing protein n=1 Tax=Spinactinospora alkalitolerans TaxID=687207 RepID=UPI0028B031C0|nr:SHOCT domain-containing protein [Spinactinospora alkalitolerans]